MERTKEIFIIGTCLLMWAVLLSGWTYTYDIATPLGSDAPSVLDDRDREIKAAVQERMNVDHYWPLTGTQVSDVAAGQHRQIEFYGPISTPTYAANKFFLYSKDVGSVVEFFLLDELDNEIQITSGGEIEYQSISDVNSNTYIVSVDDAGTGTANLIKADANDLATLPDGAVLASATASGDGDRTIADKGYVDDSPDFGVWNDYDEDDSGDSFADDTEYTAATDGIVMAYLVSTTYNLTLDGQTPTGTSVMQDSVAHGSGDTGDIANITFAVKKGDTWKVVKTGTGDATVKWMPIGN